MGRDEPELLGFLQIPEDLSRLIPTLALRVQKVGARKDTKN